MGMALTLLLQRNKVTAFLFHYTFGESVKTCEFEEKEYEGPLYTQLERGNLHLWNPGQVLESYLGFDRAFFLEDPYLFDLHHYRSPLRGFLPSRFGWPAFPSTAHGRFQGFVSIASYRRNARSSALVCPGSSRPWEVNGPFLR